MSRTQNSLHRCLALLHDGQALQAETLARQGVDDDPDDGSLWQLLGLMRRRRGDLVAARPALEAASLLVPLSPAARCALADCYARTGWPDLARDLYRLLAGDAACPTCLLPAIASGLGSVGDDEAALGVCRELSRREPTRHEALFGIAFYMRRLGHPPEAILPMVARAHELAPGVTPYRVLLALLLGHVGQHHEAADLLREVPPDSIDCPCCLNRMRAVFRLAGDHAWCRACRDQAERIGDA